LLCSSKLESLKETGKKGKWGSGEKGKWSAGKADIRSWMLDIGKNRQLVLLG
jgi:hypothetical protein